MAARSKTLELPPEIKLWDGEKLVRCRKTGSKDKPGVEYKTLEQMKGDDDKDYGAGSLFIGYETKNHYNNKLYVKVVRWVRRLFVM